jgi:serine/threonine-protein kinase HipA
MTSEAFVWMHLPGQAVPTLAGRIRHEATPGGAVGRFVYGKSYLANPAAVAIDPFALPLREEEYASTTLGGHFSALLDAGPDSWGRRLAALDHGPQDELGYLLCTRGDQAGALSFSAAPDAPPVQGRLFEFSSIDALGEAAMLVDQGAPLKARHLKLLQPGSGGARPKFSVIKDDALWLAKLESVKDLALPANLPQLEAATLDLAALAGIEVPEHEVVNLGTRKALLIRRFDRDHERGTWRRTRYVSARTVFYSNPELQRWSEAGSYPRLSRELARWSYRPADDRRQVLLRLAFNCLASNTDDHDLNHGLVVDAQGWHLAPAFDLVPQPSGTRRRMQALLVGEQGADATRANILSAAGAYGLSAKAAGVLVDEVREAIAGHWRTCLANNGIAKAAIGKLASSFVPEYFGA